MSIECKFPTAAEAKKHNWFSRRHQTSAEHQDASDARKQRVLAQYRAAEERVAKQEIIAAAKVTQYHASGETPKRVALIGSGAQVVALLSMLAMDSPGTFRKIQ